MIPASMKQSRTCRVEVLEALTDPVDVGLVPDVVKGEVLVDSRGYSSFQKSPRDKGVGAISQNSSYEHDQSN